MSLLELFKKYNITYFNQDDNKTVPYTTYIRLENETLWADNQSHFNISRYRIERYFNDIEQEIAFEKQFENDLTENGHPFSKSEDIEINKNIYMVVYTVYDREKGE